MAHINLLPWRADRRKQREREFYGQLALTLVLGLVIVFVWVFWMGLRIDNQHNRNDYLQGQIDQLDAKIKKINELEEVRSNLIDRKNIVEDLQSDRSRMVHLFDEIVTTIPDSVRLTSMKAKDEDLSLDGVAESNASVAEYMRHLEASPWMKGANLKKTINHHNSTRAPYSFELNVSLDKPDADKQETGAESQTGSAGSGPTPGQAAQPATPTSAASGAAQPATTASALAATRVKVGHSEEGVADSDGPPVPVGSASAARAASAANAQQGAGA